MSRLAVQLLILFTAANAQYRGGSISWERLPDSNVVRFTVHTAWARTAKTFVKIVDGVSIPNDGSYMPEKGDVVNVLGIETPKFVTSNGFESYLQMTVTSNTENPENGGANDWTSWTTNYIEGFSTYDVAFDSDQHTYVAELQGCCRQTMMRSGDGVCVDYFVATGILKLCNSPYHLRATVNLNLDPPPLSFFPHWVPFRFSSEQNITMDAFQLPVVDFMESGKVAPSKLPWRDPEGWDAKLIREGAAASGSLASTASELGPADAMHRAGRRLLDKHGEEEDPNLDPWPPLPVPTRVIATASVTGTNMRMVKNEEQMLTLFASHDCTGSDMIKIPAGMDLCNGTMAFPSGVAVEANVSCVILPGRMNLEITNSCSVSSPPRAEAQSPVEREGDHTLFLSDSGTGTVPICNNYGSDAPKVCRLQRGSSIPRMFWTTKLPEPCAMPGCETHATYSPSAIPDVGDAVSFLYTRQGQTGMYISNALPNGNYPVTIMVSTSTSCSTMLEIILHVMDDSYTIKYDFEEDPVVQYRNGYIPRPFPTGFRNRIAWDFVGDVPASTLMFNNINPYMFGGDMPELARADEAPQATLTWSPCLANVGLYFVCANAVAITDRYIWAPLVCVPVRVVEDLAPRITIYPLDKPGEDQSEYSLYMGESLEAVIMAFDNPSDTIDFVGISKVDMNTGDKIRAKVSYLYMDVRPTSTSEREAALMPRLVEPGVPPFLSLILGGPVNATITATKPHTMDRVLSYTPTRMHSGLEFSICFLAVDARGVCPKEAAGEDRIGSGTERCMHVSVYRCKYALNPGQELSHIAGLFETNWIQLFSLNPTFSEPEVPLAGSGKAVVNIGHLYKVMEGENLYDIVRSMGTTHNHIRFLNADISRQKESWWTEALPTGMHVCVIPNGCVTNV
mmetsp:Transcript_67864/g.141502  ORF Transcript_67864/g.141502 Transcript_67864/m.141502 type:complete len:905 (-) Transcript_67864:79-2793(-)|eukprot:CAMPEP_0181298588 /NCGR_PEP_ID=MMETSP1101-20121128/5864_1 /TAXON_ID=46948 /ORGANISM="Rhodomonas abbreviata, Strain Caron Lab Isolate" /LENGTH=904 /DNA_ID=CAMNT_0023403623 /DNA_START=157 /DNA_END=2871 /DNA_ORIENTATION=-